MAQQIINVGAAPNDGLGDPIRTAYIKCNTNFGELYSRVQVTPPSTLIGSVGDQAGMYAYDSNYFYYCYANYTGNSQIWGQVSELGNVIVTQIVNGTSDVVITDINGNIAVSVNGVSNVAVFTPTGMTAGNVTATNLVATNITGALQTANQPGITQLGTLVSLNVTGNTVSNNLIATTAVSSSGNITATGNVIAGNVNSLNSITAAGNVNATNLNSTGNVVSLGAISAVGDITTTGTFIGTFAGNITGNFVVPGANTQVIFNTNGNADAVAAMTFDTDSNVFSVLGNVSASNLSASTAVIAVGNITGGNIITAGLASITGNVTGGNVITAGQITAGTTITATGNITGGNLTTAGRVTATGNITGGNIITVGVISASGNVTGGNLIGGGVTAVSNITGGNISITSLGSFGNVSASGNVTGANLNSTNLSATTLTVTGNITSGNLIVNTAISSLGTISAVGNVDSGAGISSQGNITAVGNISAGAFIAGGIIQATSTITGGAFATAGAVTASGNITATGNVSGGNVVTAGQVVATGNISGGNLLVTGNIVDTGALTVITGSNGNITLSPNGSGVIVASKDIRNGQANAVGNIGSSTGYFNTVFASATSALYADLAEFYLADADYAPGTVLCFGGSQEVTECNVDACTAVAGVVSTNPAYQMNSGLVGEHVVAMALVGRVPVMVQGPVARGDMMVSAGNGRARAEKHPAMGTVIGKALQDFDGVVGEIEVVVGKL